MRLIHLLITSLLHVTIAQSPTHYNGDGGSGDAPTSYYDDDITFDDVSPTISSSPTEPHSKVFQYDEDTRCKLLTGEQRKYDVYEDFSREQCDNKCGFKTKCKSYSWNSKVNECTIFNFRVKGTRKNKVGSVCARIPEETKAPTKAPVPPTPSPTSSPTKKPECKIKAHLAFDFNDPDKAPYYGGHADWLEVSKKNYYNNYICSSTNHFRENNPGWCEYKNSDKDGDSAMVENLEDYYYTDEYLNEWESVTSETITVKDAADHVTIIEAYHWLFEQDYYPDDPDWQDHMMVPGLTVTNLSNPEQGNIGEILKHPAEKNVSTHIKKDDGQFVGNPNYKGNISVEIHCNKFCRCEQKYFASFNGFEDMRL